MKTICKIAGKIMILVLSTVLMWILLTPVFRKNPSTSAYQLSLLPENSLDVLVLGSSHAQYSVNPGVIYDHSNLYSFVMGSGCQPMIMSYYFLEEALKTQHPDVVILDIFTMLPSQSVCYADGMFYLAGSQLSGDTRIQAINDIDNEDKIKEYLNDLPITHDRWKEEGFYKRYIDGMMGFVPLQPSDFSMRYVAEMQPSGDSVELRKKDVDALMRIFDLCKNENIELILMKSIFDRTQKDVDALDAVRMIAEENGIIWIDFHDLADEMNFMFGMDGESWHHTTWGAEKVSSYLAQFLIDKKLCSHKVYEEIEPIYQNLAAASVQWLFEQNEDIYTLMKHAARYDVTVIVRYLGNETANYLGEYENHALNKMGIDFDFIENCDQNYYAVIQNREVVMASSEPFELDVNGTSISIQEHDIKAGNRKFSSLGELEIIFCGNDFSWFQEMPLDVHTKAFWKNGCAGWVCFGE